MSLRLLVLLFKWRASEPLVWGKFILLNAFLCGIQTICSRRSNLTNPNRKHICSVAAAQPKSSHGYILALHSQMSQMIAFQWMWWISCTASIPCSSGLILSFSCESIAGCVNKSLSLGPFERHQPSSGWEQNVRPYQSMITVASRVLGDQSVVCSNIPQCNAIKW